MNSYRRLIAVSTPGLLLFYLVLAGCQSQVEPDNKPDKPVEAKAKMITEEAAIQAARKAIEGKVTLQRGSPVTVQRVKDRYIVTFVYINPPDTAGPDYAAQVTLDANTGEVLGILVGP